MTRLWTALASLRTTAALMGALAMLLTVNVLVPQASGATRAAHDALVARGPAVRFVLVQLGLGDIPSSRIFHAALALFFANLAAVLGERAAVTLRRTRFRPPGAAQLAALRERGGGPWAPAPAGWSPAAVPPVLAALGYRAAPAGEGAIWGVKHRLAPLGFLLFHASLFLLCAGGIWLWGTRQVGLLSAVEGQTVGTADVRLARRAPWGGAGSLRLTANDVFVHLADGKPAALGAELVPDDPARAPQVASVNHPAVWGDVTVLTEAVGIAPVLALRDGRGFTLDEVAVVARGGPAAAPLGPGGLTAVVDPIPAGAGFPERAALATTRVSLRLERGGLTVFAGALRPGERVRVDEGEVALTEIRYWIGLRIVRERGGALLILGFLLAVVGIAWRLLWYRREVLVTWDDRGVQVAGRAELFPERFEAELAGIRGLLLEVTPSPAVAAERSAR